VLNNPFYLDLTHTLSEQSPRYPGKTGFKRKICRFYEQGVRLDDIELSTGIGTHIDAPNHFYPDLPGVDKLEISRFIATACIFNIADQVVDNADFLVTAQHIENWESRYGKIPEQALFLIHTGWSQFWFEEKYCLEDSQGICHFPGIDASAAQFLVNRQVTGVGIDTMGIDAGFCVAFEAHKILLLQKIYILENVANLAQLPATGATVYAFPMKIADAPEAPVRIIAYL
jgi:kynurenine formamidase